MRRGFRRLWALVVPFMAIALLAGQLPASAAGVAHDRVVSDVPSRTPQILDGKVTDLEQVGNRIVVTGTFTQVQNVAPNGTTVFNRSRVFAFDPVTGAVDTAFAPAVTATAVNTAAAGPNGTVYLGGSISAVNGTTIRNVAQVSLATGALTAFRPAATNGIVNDLQLSGTRLYVAGAFTTVGGQPHGGLATLNPTSGARDAYMGVDVTINHNWTSTCTNCARGPVGITRIDITPDGQRLVAIGNFEQADGLVRDQVAVVLLQAGAPVVDPNWRTRRYAPACKSVSFDSYVRDVEYAPDGSHFVVVTTGAHYAGTLCDTAARWNTSDTGDNVQPRWIADTGGDTLLSVAVTDAAVYVGGHQRWMNNPLAGNWAGAGAVPRPGIAALDPRNGVPLPWNPGRNPRGYGAEALLTTSTGLYVGMDTDYFGNFAHMRKKLGFFPLAGGAAPASQTTRSLPATVWLAGRAAAAPGAGVDDVLTRFYDGTTAAADARGPAGGVAWSQARGAFMVGDTLFYGFPNGSSHQLVRRTFDGTTFGPATPITTPYLDPAWAGISTGSGTSTYDGALPNFYGTELAGVTGMFYADGRLYYTKAGSSALLSRGFSVDSGIVEATATTVAATGFGDAGGMFVSGGSLYVANRTNGDLRRIAFTNGAPVGAATVVSGPTRDQRDWRTAAMFLGPAGSGDSTPNQPPTAGFTSSCADLTCSFTGSGTDPDGDPLGYAWSFGDGATGSGASTTRTYAAGGTYEVTLTVTDGRGGSTTATRSVTVTAPVPAQGIVARGAAGARTPNGGTSISVTVPSVEPGDGLVLLLSTNSAVTGTAPAGYTQAAIETEPTSSTNPAVQMTTQVFQRVATGTEDGTRLTVALSGGAKASLQLVAYGGTAAGGPIGAIQSTSTSGGTAHTTPSATARAGDWVLSAWADKGGLARSWTPPGGQVVRSHLGTTTSTSSEITALATDRGAPVAAAGTVGGLTASVSATSAKATMLTIVIAAG